MLSYCAVMNRITLLDGSDGPIQTYQQNFRSAYFEPI